MSCLGYEFDLVSAMQVVLRKLAGADPDGRRHCIKLLRTFEYRSHLCLVFEAMVSLPLLLSASIPRGPDQVCCSCECQRCSLHGSYKSKPAPDGMTVLAKQTLEACLCSCVRPALYTGVTPVLLSAAAPFGLPTLSCLPCRTSTCVS